MSIQTIIRTVEFKLYPTKAQAATLETWLRRCCWLYNRCLEQRIKAYKRRGESVNCYRQQVLLTALRSRMPRIAEVPAWFARSALSRLDKVFQAFFRRCKSGERPGFPRFKSAERYRSMEFSDKRNFIKDKSIFIPKIGTVRARGQFGVEGEQRLLRIVRRADGWYAQVVLDQGECPPPVEPRTFVGVDVGLIHFAALSDGGTVEAPRLLRQAEHRVKHFQRAVSRKRKGGANRRKAIKRLAHQHKRVAAQRKDFAHQLSRRLINRFDFIAVEALNVKGLAGGMLAKSVCDAAWGMFLFFLSFKAAYAGQTVMKVDPRGTSQTCPDCGAVRRKELSERVHTCPCGATPIDRDVAAAQVVLARALAVAGRSACGGLASLPGAIPTKAGPLKQEALRSTRS